MTHLRTVFATSTLIAGLVAAAAQAAPAPIADNAPPATPPGITIKIVQIGTFLNVPGSNFNRPRERIIFADDRGVTLYTSAGDTPGKSNCVDECAKTWVPLAAPADAAPAGHWSLIARQDGVRQWAFRGQALYTYAKEGQSANPSSQPSRQGVGNAAGSVPPPPATSATGHEVDGHEVLEILPKNWMKLPAGIFVREVRTAPGYVLTTENGLPIYTFAGKAGTALSDDWAPVEAPQLALPVGDFTILSRQDGVYQWAYRGKPVYTFNGDLDFGDSNGKQADARFDVVYALRYFLPDSVKVAKNHIYGGLLTTADGRTLYTRELGQDGVDYAARADRGNTSTGQRIGLTGCDAECEREWKPFLAPDTAKPTGYWTVYNRPDGKKQWAYYGYALYTYAKDQPGQMTGNLTYDQVADAGTAKAGQQQVEFGMRWRVAPP